jgi:Baseplate J-like protein
MAEIKLVNERQVIDYMARDYDSFLASMRALIPDKLPEWTDYQSEADFGNVLLQLFAHMGDILSYYLDRVANESFLGTAQTRRSIIHHLQLIGYQLATAAPASTTLTLTFPADCQATVTLKKGDAFATKSQNNQPPVRFEYTRDAPLVIDCSQLSVIEAKGKKYKQYPGVPVEEGRLIREEILGTSDGSAYQKLTLAHSPLILRSRDEQTVHKDILLITDQSGVIIDDSWTLRASLAFSSREQPDFIIEIDELDRATVRFGDGILGLIPPKGAVIKATYRVGGGTLGNVAANTIQTIAGAPQLTLVGAKVTNPTAATGGAQRESIEHAVLHAPTVFRSMRRAVTTADYQALALNFPGVGKVRAVAANWNTVKLYVAPQGGGKVSDVLRTNLLAYFEDKRPITTQIDIANVDYVMIFVTARIGVKNHYEPNEVKAQVQQAAGQLLAFEQVDFAQTVYLSKFYEAIETVEGVKHVTITEFRRERTLTGLELTTLIQRQTMITTLEITLAGNLGEADTRLIATAQVQVKTDTDPQVIQPQLKPLAQSYLALDHADIQLLTLQLSQFYEAVGNLPGVESVTAQTCQYQGSALQIESKGKIELAANEIPQAPTLTDYPLYLGGIQVLIEA